MSNVMLPTYPPTPAVILVVPSMTASLAKATSSTRPLAVAVMSSVLLVYVSSGNETLRMVQPAFAVMAIGLEVVASWLKRMLLMLPPVPVMEMISPPSRAPMRMELTNPPGCTVMLIEPTESLSTGKSIRFTLPDTLMVRPSSLPRSTGKEIVLTATLLRTLMMRVLVSDCSIVKLVMLAVALVGFTVYGPLSVVQAV